MMPKTLILLLTSVLLTGTVFAETPRFRGPENDGKFTATGLLREWPEGGPPIAWVTDGLGVGYASVSVSDGRLFVPGMTAQQQGYLHILDMSGNLQASISYGPETHCEWAPGPRSTPAIDGERAYLLSGPGVLYAIDIVNNTVLWQVDVLERFRGQNITWSLAESLLIYEDKVICTPGGRDGVVVALDKMTGDTLWTMSEIQDAASYCAPAIITHNDRRILVTMTATNVLGINPDTGALLWNHGHRTRHDIHAVTPVYHDGLLYYTGGYGSGGGALALSADGSSVSQVWDDKTLDCQHHGVVLVDGYLYGTAHQGRSGLVCLDMGTGNVMWTAREISQGNIVYADGMLYIYEGPRAGVVSLIHPSPEGLDVRGRFTVTDGTEQHWPHPSIAHGMLYVRRGDAVIAYDIRAQ